MEDYRLTVGIDPTDKYAKARKDLLQALRSVRQLTSDQQQALVVEFFGAEKAATAFRAFQQLFR